MATAKRYADDSYNERMKALRLGEFDARIFRMMASDVPLRVIAKRIKISPYHLTLHANGVLKAFRAPDDAIKPFPWARRVVVK
nr:hypothetical protein [uncultured Cohaesibacter sp.]